jgi:hypothetical protein
MDRYLRIHDKSVSDEEHDREEGCRRSEAVRKGTDLKRKRLFSPHRFFYKPIVNVRGMIVISHRLCHVPINR